MKKIINTKRYDLEERTYIFAKDCRLLVRQVKRTVSNIEDCSQLVRSSGSVAANYIEANDSLSKKDFRMRVKICKKESKESRLWLRLLEVSDSILDSERKHLLDEATQLMNIFGAILEKSK
jgi:four helix bundle protein